EAPRYFIGVLVELSPGPDLGHDHFQGGNTLLFMDAHRNAPSVVRGGDRVVLIDGDLDPVAVSGHGLIDGIVHHFIDQMVQSPWTDVAYVHGGSHPYVFHALQGLDTIL